jgi:hypothetical protein
MKFIKGTNIKYGEAFVVGAGLELSEDSRGRPTIIGSGSAESFLLDDLADVTISAPSTDDVLAKSAGDWVKFTPIGGGQVVGTGHTHDADDWDASTWTQGGVIYATGTTALGDTGATTQGAIIYAVDTTDWNPLAHPGANQVLRGTTTIPNWGTITSDFTTGTFPPDSHALSSHTGSLPVTSLAGATPQGIIRTIDSGTAWEVYSGGALNDFLRLKDTGGDEYVWEAHTLVAGDIPDLSATYSPVAHTHDADDWTAATWTTGGVVYATGTTSLGDTGAHGQGAIIYAVDTTDWTDLAHPGTNTVLKGTGTIPSWGTIDSNFTTGTFPPDSHSLDSHSGSLSLSNLGGAAPASFIRSSGDGTAWEQDAGTLNQFLRLINDGGSEYQWTGVSLTAAMVGIGTFPAGAFAFQGGKVTFAQTATGYASVNLPHGTAPTTPASGDMWTTNAGVYAHINGVTELLISGTVAVNQGGTGKTSWNAGGIVYASGTTTLTDTGAPTQGALVYAVDTTSWNDLAHPGSNTVLRGTGVAPSWGQVTSAFVDSTVYSSGGTDVAVADGGTGRSSLTTGALLVGAGTSQVDLTLLPAEAGQYARSTGAGAWALVSEIPIADVESHSHAANEITAGTFNASTSWKFPANSMVEVERNVDNDEQTFLLMDGGANAPDFALKVGSDASAHNGSEASITVYGVGTGGQDFRFYTANWAGGYFFGSAAQVGTPKNYARIDGSGSFSTSGTAGGRFSLYSVTDAQLGWGTGTEAIYLDSVATCSIHGLQVDTSGNVIAGAWQSTDVGVAYGGTGKSSWNAGGIVYASGTTTLTDTGAPTQGALVYAVDTSSWNDLAHPGANQVLRGTGVAPNWGTITSAYTTGTFAPSSHAYNTHSGEVPIADLAGYAGQSIIRSNAAGDAWEGYSAGTLGQYLKLVSDTPENVWAGDTITAADIAAGVFGGSEYDMGGILDCNHGSSSRFVLPVGTDKYAT